MEIKWEPSRNISIYGRSWFLEYRQNMNGKVVVKFFTLFGNIAIIMEVDWTIDPRLPTANRRSLISTLLSCHSIFLRDCATTCNSMILAVPLFSSSSLSLLSSLPSFILNNSTGKSAIRLASGRIFTASSCVAEIEEIWGWETKSQRERLEI